MVSDPIGDEGLSIEDSRKITELSMSSGAGDRRPSLVAGPLDRTKSPNALDALLKTIEEISTKPLYLVLWADHLAGVIPTIRSRTVVEWCPATVTTPTPYAWLDEKVDHLLKAMLADDTMRVLNALESAEKGEWADLLKAALPKMASEVNGENARIVVSLWERVRPILDGNGSVLVAADALLPQAS